MNSRQVSFYLADKDRVNFENALRKAGDFRILESVTEGDTLNCLIHTDILRMGEERLKIYLVLPEHVDLVQTEIVHGKSYRTVNVEQSPVIEFVRCYQTRDIIRAGRLYCVSAFFRDDGVLVRKNPLFLEWANQVLKRARSTLSKGGNTCYYGRDALNFKETGMTLEP